MSELLESLYISAMVHLNHLLKDEKGAVDLVTIVVLIGIALVLAVTFKDRITKILKTMFDNIEKKAGDLTK